MDVLAHMKPFLLGLLGPTAPEFHSLQQSDHTVASARGRAVLCSTSPEAQNVKKDATAFELRRRAYFSASPCSPGSHGALPD